MKRINRVFKKCLNRRKLMGKLFFKQIESREEYIHFAVVNHDTILVATIRIHECERERMGKEEERLYIHLIA